MKSTILVLDAAATYNLVTVEDVLLELQITDPSDSQVALIEKQIAGVSAAIAKYCDRVFASERVEETLWEPRNAFGLRQGYPWHGWGVFPYNNACVKSLFLKRYPITNMDYVYVDDVSVMNDSSDSVLRIDRDNGILYKLAEGYPIDWSFGKAVVATYTGGYETIPEDLQRVAIRMVENAWFAAGQDTNLKSEQVYGIASVTYGTGTSVSTSSVTGGIPDDIKLQLEPYIRSWGFA